MAASVVALGGKVLRKARLSLSSTTVDLLMQQLGGARFAQERVEPGAGVTVREPR